MTTEAAAKKDIQKLQRVIIDGLEDVKAQDIQVFDTEHLSALFERVIIASGTSNRQTKALAMSVRDAVNEAKFGKPRLEGESNGEWIIVDCGAAVVHIMQPAIRQYYHLEELWGDKPVRLKFGAAKPVVAVAEEAAPAKKKAPIETLRRSSAAKTAIKAAEQVLKAEKEAERAAERPRRGPSRKGPGARSGSAAANSRAVAKRALPAGKTAAPASKPVASKPAVKTATRAAAPAAPVAKKAAARPAAKSATVPATKVAAKKTAAVKTPVKVIGKPAAKPAAKAAPAKKVAARKTAAPRG
jgi:ribosome-associated protein